MNQDTAQGLYQGTCIDLGDKLGPEFKGILSPGYEDQYVEKYLHDQFSKHAEKYFQAYTKHQYFENLIRKSLKHTSINTAGKLNILDIGSGSGNSIFPLLNIFPGASIIASDLSKELLAILKKELEKGGLSDRVALMQLNAEELLFQEQSLDLIVGAAILHHLFNPGKTIGHCYCALKQTGYAIFFEPVQNGKILVRMAYAMLLKDKRARELPRNVSTYIENRIKFIDIRCSDGNDKSHPRYLTMDDKWMFPRNYLLETARMCGFTDCVIKPLNEIANPVEREIRVHFKHAFETDVLPGWAWESIREFDAAMPDDFKRDNPPEAAIILVKRPA